MDVSDLNPPADALGRVDDLVFSQVAVGSPDAVPVFDRAGVTLVCSSTAHWAAGRWQRSIRGRTETGVAYYSFELRSSRKFW
jgi:hypothetical protein